MHGGGFGLDVRCVVWLCSRMVREVELRSRVRRLGGLLCHHVTPQANVECEYGGWQAPLLLTVVVLTSVPLALPWIAGVAARKQHAIEDDHGPDSGRMVTHAWSAVHWTICSPYHKSSQWWESVLMAHRLVLGLVFTLGSATPMVQSLVDTVICVVVLVWHLVARPFRDAATQHLQSLLLSCLTIVSAATLPGAEVVQIATSGSSTSAVVDGVMLTFGMVLPVVGLVTAYVAPVVMRSVGGVEAVRGSKGAGSVGGSVNTRVLTDRVSNSSFRASSHRSGEGESPERHVLGDADP